MIITASEFQKASKDLGITDYPPELDAFAESEYSEKFDPADLETIGFLQKSDNFFDQYYDLVVSAAKELPNHPSAHLWAKVVSQYIYAADCEKAREVKIPQPFIRLTEGVMRARRVSGSC